MPSSGILARDRPAGKERSFLYLPFVTEGLKCPWSGPAIRHEHQVWSFVDKLL